jgi:hypothetical protein
VQRNQLHSQKIVPGGNAHRHREVVPAAGGDHLVDGPLPVGEPLVRDFEPLEPRCAGRCGVVDFGEVVEDGSWVWLAERAC